MILDSLLSFVAPGTPLSLVGSAGVAIPSNVLDLLGVGSGNASSNIIGDASVFGEDTGIGGVKPQVQVNIGTACTTSTSATLNVAFQAAIDDGSNAPGTWETLIETGPIAVADLTAGAVLARFDFPPAFPPGLSPRFLRLLFQVPSGTDFTAGTVASAIVTKVRDDQANRYAARNYVVA